MHHRILAFHYTTVLATAGDPRASLEAFRQWVACYPPTAMTCCRRFPAPSPPWNEKPGGGLRSARTHHFSLDCWISSTRMSARTSRNSMPRLSAAARSSARRASIAATPLLLVVDAVEMLPPGLAPWAVVAAPPAATLLPPLLSDSESLVWDPRCRRCSSSCCSCC